MGSKPTLLVLASIALVGLGAAACSAKELDASGGTERGMPCEPGVESTCVEGLACEPVMGSDGRVCAARVEIRGSVIDAFDESPIAGALVVATDELGAPVTTVVQTDAEGRYAMPVSVQRDADGAIAGVQRWTLLVAAADHLAFPGVLRPALPINAQDLSVDHQEPTLLGTIDNASTVVALIPRPADIPRGITITGQVDAESAAGTLVVTEGLDPISLAVADQDGAFTLFNVPAGSATLRGYHQGLELKPQPVEVADADIADVHLSLVSEDLDAMGVVEGSVNIINAPGGSRSSVVLIPSSVYNEVFERGPVPVGLRAPAPPEAPSISSAFAIDGVPAGHYHVLAAFENDGLVRDPDASIAGTQIQQIEVVAGGVVDLEASIKITEALAIVGPGAEAPEEVDGTPILSWVDDSSEDRYEVVVRDALGEEVWRVDLPTVSGSEQVELPYGGSTLMPGMHYQFRVTAWRDTPQGSTEISRSEDLRGVFVVR